MEMAVGSDNVRTGLPRASIPCCCKTKGRILRYALALCLRDGGGGSKTLSRQREKAAVAGLQIFPVYKKISAGLFFSAEKGIWIARIRHREDLLGLGEIFCFE